jgi:hypothetical protein
MTGHFQTDREGRFLAGLGPTIIPAVAHVPASAPLRSDARRDWAFTLLQPLCATVHQVFSAVLFDQIT